jgi:hypothetical protein
MATQPGIGATGFVGVAFETVKGTYVAPYAHVPVLSESLKYTEDKYYSQQLRQQVIDSQVTPGYYHIAGDIEMEVDVHFLPYFLYASRHTCVKAGAGPYTYNYTPLTDGATSTNAGTTLPKTLSITCVRNGEVFGYSGCTVGQYAFTVDGGVLKVTMSIVGELEAEEALPVPTWLEADLLGADSHNVFVAASGVSPTWGAAADGFNGFTFTVNHNAEPQNRIVANRGASFVKFGKTDLEIDSELDFLDRADYDKMVASETAAFKLESTVGGAAYNGTVPGVSLQANRCAYDTYDINVGSIDAIIMGGFKGHGLAQVGGNAYEIKVTSPTNVGVTT